MRKLITTSIMTAALISFVGGTAAYAVLDFAAPTAGMHTLSIQIKHEGRTVRRHYTPLFTL